MQTPETKFQRGFRIVTGVLMALQTAAFFFIATFLFFFVLFMGGLATVAGAGNVSEEQFVNTWWMIGFIAVYPEIVAMLMIIASVQIFTCKRPVLIIIASVLFILPYVGMLYVINRDAEMQKAISITGLIPTLPPLMAVMVAVQMIKNRTTSITS